MSAAPTVKVMTPDQLTRTMTAALEEERQAIRKLDADSVARATQAKVTVLESVRSAPEGPERDALVRALGELKGELRRNLVLLAHARDSLREAIELCRGPSKTRPRLEAKL